MATNFDAATWHEQGTSCPTCGSKSPRYNGWSNYETWAVKLWMDNSSGSYEYWQERAQDIADTTGPGQYDWETAEEMRVRALAALIEEQHEEDAPSRTGIYADLLNAALQSVDWREIAESLLSEITPAETEEA